MSKYNIIHGVYLELLVDGREVIHHGTIGSAATAHAVNNRHG